MRQLKRIRLIVSLVFLILFGVACTVQSTADPTSTPIPPPASPSPEASATPAPEATPIPQIPDMSVHTPEDVRQYFEEWPEAYKLALAEDVLVLFTFPHPLSNWVGGAIIYHAPSVSTVVLDFSGNVDARLAHYEGEEGQARLEAILADAAVMSQLQARVQEIWGMTPDETAVPPGDEQGEAVSPAGLVGTEWLLVSYGPVDKPVEALANTTVTAVFDNAGQMSGSTGCNSYGTTYEIDGGSFTTGDIHQTLIACLDEDIMAQEAAFTSALNTAKAIELEEDMLTITYDGGVLRFVAGSPPPATP